MRLPKGESYLDPKSVFFIFRKHLSVENLNKKLRERFGEIVDNRQDGKVKVSLVDALMSGFSMFTLKMPSLLELDELRRSPARAHNLKNLFGIECIPSDSRMREILDDVSPDDLRVGFTDVFSHLQRGKVLEQYVYLDGKNLLSTDGTGYFSSDSIHCACCLEKKNKKTGVITYQHQMLGAAIVHPDNKLVIPVCPEPIIKQDGKKKNDCERNACRRFLEKFRKEHPKLGVIVIEDGLSSNAPHIRDLYRYNFSFILGAKPGDHKFLFEEFYLAGKRVTEVAIKDKNMTHVFRFVNGLQLNESSEDIIINFLDYEQQNDDGSKLHFSWITDIEITKDNVYKIMRGGRARWKIENETFNTLKNQGYNFEHNYGHGKKNLSVVLAFLMMLAFLIDQVQLLTNKTVQAAVKKVGRLSAFYRKVFSHFDFLKLNNWDELYNAILYGVDVSFSIKTPSKNTS